MEIFGLRDWEIFFDLENLFEDFNLEFFFVLLNFELLNYYFYSIQNLFNQTKNIWIELFFVS